MLDYSRMAAIHAHYWSKTAHDDENSLNGFSGEWAISDHSLVPQGVWNFLLERFPRKDKISQISLEDINAALNSVWHGAGSMSTVILETERARQVRVQPEAARVTVSGETTVDDLVLRGKEIVAEEAEHGDQ